MRALATALLLLAAVSSAHAATKTWIGAGSGGAGTDFNAATNWSPNGTPTSSDSCVMMPTNGATVAASRRIPRMNSSPT